MLTGKQIIVGQYTKEGGSAFKAVNPAKGETLEPAYYEATASEIDQAFQAAEGDFGHYRRKTSEQRAAFLDTIGEEIMALGDELIRRCMEETGLPEVRLKGERGRTVNQLKLFAGVIREGSWVDARIDEAIPDRAPVPGPDIRRMLIPLGPVGIFGAGNFPLAFSVAGGDTVSALAAGCPVVVKAHPAHPGTSELVGGAIVKSIRKSGMPKGIFSLVHGHSKDVGLAIVKHPLAKAIGFTGSYAGGKALYDAAVGRPEPIPVFAEMGSTNPVFILPGALRERGESIARGLVDSVALGVGQFCTNPGLVFLVDNGESYESEKFIKMAAQHIQNVPWGTMLTTAIKHAFETGLNDIGQMEGVTLRAQGQQGEGKCNAAACLFQTTAEQFKKKPELMEEVFGPSTVVVTAAHKGELVEAAKGLRGQLTATIHCGVGDLEKYGEVLEELERRAGRLVINSFPTGVEVSPAMHHGGPFPATMDSRTTSVGTAAIERFVRPVCYQGYPQNYLPEELKDGNPLLIQRRLNGEIGKK
ncbi:MAG: aldehyde dehydrogenase (NADP(+)) [bacterium]|nr:aldehyde dehydrogenase (NADP(+)) [bacterium]